MNYDVTKAGKPSVYGHVLPTTANDHDMRPGREDAEDLALRTFLNPDFEATLREVCHEVESMRLSGTLRPFVEGEPIGVLPKRKKTKPTKTDPRAYARKMEEQRAEMLELRRRNDQRIKEVLA